MEKKIFKYKVVKIIVLLTSLLMLLLLGVGLYDLIDRDDVSLQSFTDRLTIIIVSIIFLLKLISLLFVVFKLSGSVLLLNIYYISSLSILVFGTIMNSVLKNEPYSWVNIFIITSLSTLLFLVNRFKYKAIQYQNIDLIGTHND